jgi:DNA-binding transcriptional MerR regulator/methylmalonyl-CoA mutase cobalamin-binding subunit
MSPELVRIGELSRRTGVSPELLRAWELRYGLLEPGRTVGRFRLYSEADIALVRRMRANLDAGLSASEAARVALAERSQVDSPGLREAADDLARSLESYDDVGAQGALDMLLAAFSLDTVVREVLVPYLHAVGERWQRGELSVGQEHFISNLIRGRLLALSRGWDRGVGPRAVLASAEGDQHDLPVLLFGVLLRTHGWRITFLGANTPVASLAETVRAVSPDVVVITGTVQGVFDPLVEQLREVAREAPVYLAGPAADDDLARQADVMHLDGDLVEATSSVSRAA